MRNIAIAASILAALVIAPFAIAAGEGDPIEGGERNPSNDQSLSLTRETEIIANTSTYGTRQSNKSNNGGGAIYGCRAQTGTRPCLRSVNLANGRAFELRSTGGPEAGRIEVGGGGDTVRPFSTNATGTATGLNADEVDGFDGAQIVPRFAAVTQTGTLAGNRGATASSRTGEGNFTVTFAADVNNCAYSATVVGGEGGFGIANVEPVDARNLRIRTFARAGDNPPADRPFHLVVFC